MSADFVGKRRYRVARPTPLRRVTSSMVVRRIPTSSACSSVAARIRVVISSALSIWARTMGSGSLSRRTNSAVRVEVNRSSLLLRGGRRIVASEACETLRVSLYRMYCKSSLTCWEGFVNRVALRARWLAMHGVPRAYFAVQARRGDPLARMLRSGAIDRYSLMEDIRARGRLVRSPHVWGSVDHAVCREVLRDKRFGVTAPSEMELPPPLKMLIAKTDPGVPNPVEPPAMVIVNPPDHTRYRHLVAQSFTPRAIDGLEARVTEVTVELIERISTTPNPDLIADFATQLPVAIIAEILGLPADSYPRMLQWGHSGAPLLDVGIDWKTYRDAVNGMRDVDDYLIEHFRKLRAGQPGDNPFSRMVADGSMTDRELTANAALIVGAGFETTVNLIGNGIVLLLQQPEQLRQLHDNPDLWPNAIEEILRLASPVQMTARTPACDVEIAGNHIGGGT